MSRPAGRVLRQPDQAPPLSEAERQRAAAAFAEVKRLMPDMPAEIKALHELGLIDGLRAIRYIGPIRPKAPGGFSVHDMFLLTAEQIAEEEKRYGKARK